jgi:hypothetical protein
MTERRSSSNTPTRPVAPRETPRRAAVREQARREIPALRRQAEEGIATLRRLAQQSER